MRVLGALLLLAMLGLGGLIWNFNRPPFNLARLQELRPGMSQHEVRQILGAPNSDYGSRWAYSSLIAWPIVYIDFDESKRFSRSVYDH